MRLPTLCVYTPPNLILIDASVFSRTTNENRTRDSSVKGRRLNPLTMAANILVAKMGLEPITWSRKEKHAILPYRAGPTYISTTWLSATYFACQ